MEPEETMAAAIEVPGRSSIACRGEPQKHNFGMSYNGII